MKIKTVTPVILSCPYGSEGSLENMLHLPTGHRNASFVEIVLESGEVGVGEGYLGVFAPEVFVKIVELYTPYLIGEDISDISRIITTLETISGYWSFSGAARHVISAIDIALWDMHAKRARVPLYLLLNPHANGHPIPMYGSGGDSVSPQYMEKEFEDIIEKGITIFKIRARNHQIKKSCWCLEKGKEAHIKIAIDMTQNLAIPGQTIEECLSFENEIIEQSGEEPYFIEEPLGPYSLLQLPELRNTLKTRVAGGEIITTPLELIALSRNGCYDIVQPDASVIGGVSALQEVFHAMHTTHMPTVVHSWGAAPCMLANYHVAFAHHARLIECPMPSFRIREDMMIHDMKIIDGMLAPPTSYGLGVQLTEDIKQAYSWKKDSLYNCKIKKDTLSMLHTNESLW